MNRYQKIGIRILSYLLVAVLASILTLALQSSPSRFSKLDELQKIIDGRFIGEYDPDTLADGAADGVVNALGDRWSYYIPASMMEAHQEQSENAYVGIGITVVESASPLGVLVTDVEPEGGADLAGILPGDRIVKVNGEDVMGRTTSELKELLRGDVGTSLEVTVSREDGEHTFTVTRQKFYTKVAKYQLLEGDIGYVQIVNFNEHCAEQTIAAIESLMEQGAKSLIFDVRFNPGGYKSELVRLLDYLLPEGDLFRSLDYRGVENVDTSDEQCLEMPMAVLINSESYSAAEFFAAALEEYHWAATVGEPTQGKGYFQNTIPLSDGSAVNLSVGKYFTPNGVSLAETGGLTPNVPVDVDDETFRDIYYNRLDCTQDPQIQAAMEAVRES